MCICMGGRDAWCLLNLGGLSLCHAHLSLEGVRMTHSLQAVARVFCCGEILDGSVPNVYLTTQTAPCESGSEPQNLTERFQMKLDRSSTVCQSVNCVLTEEQVS